MRNVKWLIAAGLVLSVTGCVETNGYPSTYYSGYPTNGYYQPTYYQRPTYYQQPTYYYQQPQTRYVPVQTRYVPVPAYRPRSSWGNRDSDGDGIPNRYDRDRNNDGIPDRVQRRGWQGWG